MPLPFVPIVVSPKAIVALIAIALITLVHLRGLGPGRIVQNLLAGAKVAAILVFLAPSGSGPATVQVASRAGGSRQPAE